MTVLWVLTSLAFGQAVPQVQTETLSGAAVNLPASLASERTVLVLSFLREHQEVSNAWRPHLSALQKAGKAEWLELAFLNVNSVLGAGISQAMKLAMDDAVEQRVAPVYAAHDGVRSALGIANDKDVVLVIVDRAGQTKAKIVGKPTDANLAALKAALP